MDFTGNQRLDFLVFLLLLMLATAAGNLEPTFGRCCAYGANWARESQQCSVFPTIMAAIPTEHQSICITAAAICCLRYFRDEQCQKGKQAAQVGQDCVPSSSQGGEYFKDCCQGCKLGLFSSSMGMDCSTHFKFGFPWDYAFLQCCNTSPNLSGNQVVDSENLYPGLQSSTGVIPESENLCDKLPGKLCSDLCVPTPGSYRCMCRPGFTLSIDGKTCIQDTVTDRCQVNNPCDHNCRDTGVSIVCSCKAGFMLKADQKSCEDVDECIDDTNNCNWTTHFCVNTQGGYMCEEKSGSSDCTAGYKFSIQQQKCIDVDECAEELHGCHPEEETCRNTPGAYECDMACDEGFQFSLVLRTCVDQDECMDAPCEPGWECRNTVGSYLCHELPRAFCPAGYKPSNGTASGCEDVDECVEGLHSCHAVRELCINEIGKYRCEAIILNEVNAERNQFRSVSHATFQPQVQECPEGFGFDLTTRQCLDIDECNVGLHDCTQAEKCINTLGSYVCQPRVRCSAGFAPDPITGKCKDVDECAAGVANCLPGQICHNNEGAFDCRVECQDGFRYDPIDAAVCVDVNECLQSPCNFGEDCHNTEGSYICTISNSTIFTFTTSPTSTTSTTITSTTTKIPITCPPGFKWNPDTLQCEDLDECMDSVCELGQRCTNTYGSYTCLQLPCNQGYQRNSLTSKCEDVDECEEGLHNCQVGHEQCVNTLGGHDCQPQPCSLGFVRDPSDPRHCKDVDECESSPCKAEEECVNSNGSFSCRHLTPCSPGFIKNEENNQCEDIDECVEEAPCGPEERCVNIQGSYRCRNQHCSPGYQRNIWGQCRDVNECETGEHTCNPPKEECVNSLGSYRCKPLPDCPEGFTRNPTSLRCVDVDECVEGTHDCVDGERCFNQYGQYACRGSPSSCSGGFRYNSLDRRCKDIDECAENSDTCDKDTQTCINSKGSFRCIDWQPTCDFGYRYSEDLQICVDIDECEEGRDICNRLTEICVNNEGNYWCNQILNPPTSSNILTTTITTTTTTLIPPPLPPLPPKPDQLVPQCPLGTEYNLLSKTCVDIDECATDPCKTLEVCENTQGSYQCQCQPGYYREEPDDDCQDMNECQLGQHTCASTQRCDNTVGSYACTRIAGCGTGYTLNHNTDECDDNDECKLNTHNCDQLGPKYQCINIRGSFRCKLKTCSPLHILNDEGICVGRTCEIGYKPGEFNCVDIDECTEDNPCQQNEMCINTVGSYRCQPRLICSVGFEMNEAGTQCIDEDECAKGTHRCVRNQVCSNRRGGYICHCPQGFRLGAQQQCEDINECEHYYYGRVCANNADCENTEGSYLCKCKEGFRQASNGISCVDVDECEEVPGICSHNCINVWGTYQCTCRAGHILESDNRTCTDVDECENFRGRGHLCIGLCVNIPGSFKCTCPDGYTLATDGRTCKDINECEAGNLCRGIDEQCVNTRGGYKCNTITCPDNYVRDSRHKNRCKRLTSYCQMDDDTCRLKPLSYSYNYLPLVSNMTLSSLGQVDLFTMRGPLWASTTVQFELELEDVQTTTEIEPVTREYFQLRRTAFNQAVISLKKPIIGPQEIQLSLNMKLYQQGRFSGSAVAKLLIYVSEYTF